MLEAAGLHVLVGLDLFCGTGRVARFWRRKGVAAITGDLCSKSRIDSNDAAVQQVVL